MTDIPVSRSLDRQSSGMISNPTGGTDSRPFTSQEMLHKEAKEINKTLAITTVNNDSNKNIAFA